jgi:hypothetical protein
MQAVAVDSAGKPGTPFDVTTATSGAVGIACEANTCAILGSSASTSTPTLWRVSKTGTVLDANGISLNATSSNPLSITSDGTQYLVVYSVYGGYMSPNTILAKRVSSAGTVLDTTGITLESKLSTAWSASATWNGSRFVIVSSDGFDLSAQRLQPNGTLDDTTPVSFSAYASQQNSPWVAWSGTQGYVAWVDIRSPYTTIYGGRLSTTLTAADGDAGVLVSKGANAQESPAVAASASGYLAVWGLLKLIRSRGFTPFVIYRVLAGLAVLTVYVTGIR